MEKILHNILEERLETYKGFVEYDLANKYHLDENKACFRVYLNDLAKYVETLMFDCTVNRCGQTFWALVKYGGYKNVEEFNKGIKYQEHWLTDDEWQAIKTYQYYYGREESAL